MIIEILLHHIMLNYDPQLINIKQQVFDKTILIYRSYRIRPTVGNIANIKRALHLKLFRLNTIKEVTAYEYRCA